MPTPHPRRQLAGGERPGPYEREVTLTAALLPFEMEPGERVLRSLQALRCARRPSGAKRREVAVAALRGSRPPSPGAPPGKGSGPDPAPAPARHVVPWRARGVRAGG